VHLTECPDQIDSQFPADGCRMLPVEDESQIFHGKNIVHTSQHSSGEKSDKPLSKIKFHFFSTGTPHDKPAKKV